VDATVYQQVPGEWRWEMAYHLPDLFRWTLSTYGEEPSYVYDGEAVRAFLGSGEIPVDPSTAASFRTLARWAAVTSLDILGDPSRVSCEEIAADESSAGGATGVRARFLDDTATYDLWFDEHGLLVSAEGPVSLPPAGTARLAATYSDFRDVAGYRLPHRGQYSFAGRPLLDERVTSYRANDPAVDAASFRRAPQPLSR
jgi:hypothetical protein